MTHIGGLMRAFSWPLCLPGNTGWFAAPASRTRPGGPQNCSCSASRPRSPAAAPNLPGGVRQDCSLQAGLIPKHSASVSSPTRVGREEVRTFQNDRPQVQLTRQANQSFAPLGGAGEETGGGAIAAPPLPSSQLPGRFLVLDRPRRTNPWLRPRRQKGLCHTPFVFGAVWGGSGLPGSPLSYTRLRPPRGAEHSKFSPKGGGDIKRKTRGSRGE